MEQYKWYVWQEAVSTHSRGIINLTEDERNTMEKLFKHMTIIDCLGFTIGSFCIGTEGYATHGEAVKAACEGKET